MKKIENLDTVTLLNLQDILGMQENMVYQELFPCMLEIMNMFQKTVQNIAEL